MAICSNLSTFCGKTVVDFDLKKSIRHLKKSVYRLRLNHDNENGQSMEKLLDAFAQTRLAPNVKEIILGIWDNDGAHPSNQFVIDKLVALKDTFKQLKALFVGDITYEESEISWIPQSNMNSLWAAYPNLEHFQVRGGNYLSLGALNHAQLKTLIIEAGGLPKNVIHEISNAQLPLLKHLEVWFGNSNYGFDATIEDLETLIHGGKFPKLKFLGLKNSEIQDEIAQRIAHSPILDQLETLDLSMGTLTDIGAQALLDSPKIKNLKFLNLNHHYMTSAMMEKIQALGIKVDVNSQKEVDEFNGEAYRYIEVSE